MQNSQLEVLQGCLECLKQGQKMPLVSVAKDIRRDFHCELNIQIVRGL
jgi:hypothetical protein